MSKRPSRHKSSSNEDDVDIDLTRETMEAFQRAKQMRVKKKKNKANGDKYASSAGDVVVQSYDFWGWDEPGCDLAWQETDSDGDDKFTDADAPSSDDDYEPFIFNVRHSRDTKRNLQRREKASKRWHESVFQHLNGVVKYKMLFAIPKSLDQNTNAQCCHLQCLNPGQWICETCRNIGVEAFLCDEHAETHPPFAHKMVNTYQEMFLHGQRRVLSCQCACEIKSTHITRLHRLDSIEEVVVTSCHNCTSVQLLLQNGFFPGSPLQPSKLLFL